MTETMKVGALARRAGLSVRTLHHYDHVGLLSPTRRTATGHRLYGREEVERLQRIVSLRRLGFSLEEVRDCLSRPEYSLERVLGMHVERIDGEIGRQKRLRRLLLRLRNRLQSGGEVTLDEITRTIEVTMSHERYYTPEQLEMLEGRAARLGQERVEEVQAAWAALFAAYEDAMEQGLDPGSERVQELARRSAELVEAFTGDDPGIADSLGTMYRAEGPEKVLEGHDMRLAPGLWEYMGEAGAILRGDS